MPWCEPRWTTKSPSSVTLRLSVPLLLSIMPLLPRMYYSLTAFCMLQIAGFVYLAVAIVWVIATLCVWKGVKVTSFCHILISVCTWAGHAAGSGSGVSAVTCTRGLRAMVRQGGRNSSKWGCQLKTCKECPS